MHNPFQRATSPPNDLLTSNILPQSSRWCNLVVYYIRASKLLDGKEARLHNSSVRFLTNFSVPQVIV